MNSTDGNAGWRRMIACVSIHGFGLAVELMDTPSLSGRPVVLLHSSSQPRIVEASEAARLAGVVRGMDQASAQSACAGLSHVYARPERYAAVASRMAECLAAVSPDLEPGAPGMCYLDLTACQAYYRNDPARIARLLLDHLHEAGLPAGSVGVSGDRTTARIAAGQAGPDGHLVVPPGEAARFLAGLSLHELCGAGRGITDFLAEQAVHTCGDLARLPHAVLAERFGNHGRRLWLMAQGQDPTAVRARPAAGSGGATDVGVLRTLPPACIDEESILASVTHLIRRLRQRLQREGQDLRRLRIRLRCPEGWRQFEVTLTEAGASPSLPILRRPLRRHWFGEEVAQVQVIALAPTDPVPHPDFFLPGKRRRRGQSEAGAIRDRSRTGQSQIP